jgi:hypothetical protein
MLVSVELLGTLDNEMVTFAPANSSHLLRKTAFCTLLHLYSLFCPLAVRNRGQKGLAPANLVFREALEGLINMFSAARPGELLALLTDNS